MQNHNTATDTVRIRDHESLAADQANAKDSRVNEPGVFCVSAAIKIFDPDTQEIFLEMRA